MNNLNRMREIRIGEWLKEQEDRVKILKNCAKSRVSFLLQPIRRMVLRQIEEVAA